MKKFSKVLLIFALVSVVLLGVLVSCKEPEVYDFEAWSQDYLDKAVAADIAAYRADDTYVAANDLLNVATEVTIGAEANMAAVVALVDFSIFDAVFVETKVLVQDFAKDYVAKAIADAAGWAKKAGEETYGAIVFDAERKLESLKTKTVEFALPFEYFAAKKDVVVKFKFVE